MSKNDKSIQQKLDELEAMVDWFSSDDFELEKALDTYKAASELAEDIEMGLNKLKNEVEVIKQRFDKAE